MSLQLDDTAAGLTLDPTAGRVRFDDDASDRSVVFFSHPKDFTPACTTELGEVARRTADSMHVHAGRATDVEDIGGTAINDPLLADQEPEDDVIIAPSVSDDEARPRYPAGWKTLKPYLCLVPASQN